MSQPTTHTNQTLNSAAVGSKPAHFNRADHQRVVITGMGAVTPLGLDVDTTWQCLIQGKSGIKPITHFDASTYRAQFAGTVEGFDASQFMAAKEARRYDAFIHYGVAAASMALKQAGFIEEVSADPAPVQNVDSDRFGVIIGAGIGGLQTLEDNRDALANQGIRRVSPFSLPGSIINMAAGMVAIKHNLRGPNLATATACTSAAHAIGLAARLIAYGDCDVMLAGGSEKGSSPLGMAGFAAMGALSTRNDDPTRASRPFDKDRDGFVLGDGSGVLVLESLAHAKARGATILAELAGFGMSDDAHHITAPPTDGEGAARAMVMAIKDAGINPCKIGYINAHGTSTPAGDVAESKAIEGIFEACKDRLLVSSTKSMTGHLLGAAGAIEAIFSIQALLDQRVPPTINLDNVDEDCHLDYVANAARSVTNLNYTMSNSFGFGGTNGSLIFARWVD
ncbi:beta-ketoacyl-ACP synthase II [Psychrobacter phenylpyruvicus]|uniref:3-oxoacyl-[acyl-carrier-protein] synthase 2 n=1 Tax=Psychrobacter phenylpyruvicus TaxID=29432 RepID=A0A379LP08_9GAMM|nr:beta-ketoacyl-ACP synthase II [Psychrobacter phenylpyruvicus]SUD91855.1 3-oxoacyl-[acyl-carrier-protein] synthase 2 [Psychrobacter phenylpyruvicus]